jgi:hypothetical protein
MFKGKFVVLSLVAAALLCWQMMPAAVDTANSGIVHPCSSTATSGPGPYCVAVCPQGDGDIIGDVGGLITVVVKDQTGAPIPGIPASDYWLIGCNDALALCGGSGSINADSASNASGVTTIGAGFTSTSGTIAAGGCDDGVQVVVQGTVLKDPADCVSLLCLPINVRSIDYNGDLIVDLIDFAIFGPAFPSPPQVYDKCLDYNCDGLIDLIDFSIFGAHFLHVC